MRNGIISAGNWILDKVKILDMLPERGMLGSILEETFGGGGAPHNVLVDLAKMKVNFPLYGAGIVGNDENGKYLLSVLKECNIDAKNIVISDKVPTSYTDVMTDKTTGDRTFYHCRGANALLDVDMLKTIETNAKIFHLGYLLLLDKLDAEDKEYGVCSARLLKMLQEKGYKTSVDVVSESGDRFQRLVTPTLKYINYLIINEIEAERITGLKIRESNGINNQNLKKSASLLLEKGVNELVVIHFPEGGFAKNIKGEEVFVPSFIVQNEEIISTVGAGDAFCAGMLYAIHENIELEKAIKFANANARFNLLNPTTTGGAVAINEIEKYIQTAKLKNPIVS